MKETAFLINTSRGPIVNEFDLVEALEKNIIAGAGLDVYDIEPLPENHKLRFLPNALLLPHLGYVTKENYEVFYSQMFEISDEYLLSELLKTFVRVCDTFPFLKSKTSSFIEQAFSTHKETDIRMA